MLATHAIFAETRLWALIVKVIGGELFVESLTFIAKSGHARLHLVVPWGRGGAGLHYIIETRVRTHRSTYNVYCITTTTTGLWQPRIQLSDPRSLTSSSELWSHLNIVSVPIYYIRFLLQITSLKRKSNRKCLRQSLTHPSFQYINRKKGNWLTTTTKVHFFTF